jgi:hypothetical protein
MTDGTPMFSTLDSTTSTSVAPAAVPGHLRSALGRRTAAGLPAFLLLAGLWLPAAGALAQPGPVAPPAASTAVVAGSPAASAAEVVGEVLFAQGAITAERAGEPPRFLVPGDSLARGDVISTGARGFAQLALKDGTRLSLRPNTRFNVTGFSQQPGSENLAMELLRGGLRAISGLISKAGPDRMRVQAGTATIGVRGTEFDARLCEGDCAAEQRAGGTARGLAQERVVARVARLNGTASAADAKGAVRALAQDAALFEGETVRTAAVSSVVLAFRDQSVMTVAPASELRLESVRVGASATEGSFVVRLLTGGLRLITGQIARANPRAVRVQTSTATIGVRGTEFDVVLALHCVAGVCTPSTFTEVRAGTITMALPGGQEIEVPAGLAGLLDPKTASPQVLKSLPAGVSLGDTAPLPGTIRIDFKSLFSVTSASEVPPGLYVAVTSGNVSIQGGEGVIDLGPSEAAALLQGQGRPVRLQAVPVFILNDPVPRPDAAGNSGRMLPLLGIGPDAGAAACEVR